MVLALNGYDNINTIRTYQNMYPDVLMLRDPNWGVYQLYRQNGYIPLNYVLTQELIVDYFMEGFSEGIIRNHIENLLAPVTVVLSYDGSPVPQGGTLSFDVTLTNWENTEQTFYALTEVTLPGGTTVILLGPVEITLDANQEVTVPLQHNIPLAAPLGMYEYTGMLGTFPPPEVMDYSSFEFEVVAP